MPTTSDILSPGPASTSPSPGTPYPKGEILPQPEDPTSTHLQTLKGRFSSSLASPYPGPSAVPLSPFTPSTPSQACKPRPTPPGHSPLGQILPALRDHLPRDLLLRKPFEVSSSRRPPNAGQVRPSPAAPLVPTLPPGPGLEALGTPYTSRAQA